MDMNKFRLDGKVALVTGASYGIGFAIATALAKAGATICFNDRNPELIKKGIEEYAKLGIKAYGYQCDITDEEAVNNLVKTIKEEVGIVDILVNNAGITKDNLILRMNESDFDDVINVNLKGSFNCLKAVPPIMLKQKRGKIINMASVVGVIGNPGQVNYCASKAGVIGMTKSLAKELGGKNINVNAIAPGFIDTDMTRVLSEDQKKNILSQVPLKRLGLVSDIANVAAFLASEDSDYITGQVIHVDGGMAM